MSSLITSVSSLKEMGVDNSLFNSILSLQERIEGSQLITQMASGYLSSPDWSVFPGMYASFTLGYTEAHMRKGKVNI